MSGNGLEFRPFDLGERPEVEVIRTMNANSNAPMLKINIEMGFKHYRSNTLWQVETPSRFKNI